MELWQRHMADWLVMNLNRELFNCRSLPESERML